MKKLVLSSLFLFLFFGVNFAFADDSEVDPDFEIYQHPYIKLIIPELQVYEDNFNENMIDFKIDFIDLRKPNKSGEWHGLGPFHETNIKPHDVDKHDLENRIIRSTLKDSTGNTINATNYKLISTGENKFETNGKVKDQVYIQWYEDEGLWEKYSDGDKKSLMYEPHMHIKEITPIEPIDAKDFHHMLNNKAIFPDVRYTVEGKIHSNSFITGEKYTFEVYSSSSSSDSIIFEIPNKEIIPEKQEEILTDEDNEQRTEQNSNELEKQQIIQTEKALKEHEEKKRLQELENQVKPQEDIIETKPVMDLEPTELIPEPTYIPEPQPQCGQGTESVGGFCKVIKSPKTGDNFFDSFFKMFSALFD